MPEEYTSFKYCDTCNVLVPIVRDGSSIDQTIAAKRMANECALTFAHPAARHYRHLYDSLTPDERAAVSLAVPLKLWQ